MFKVSETFLNLRLLSQSATNMGFWKMKKEGKVKSEREIIV